AEGAKQMPWMPDIRRGRRWSGPSAHPGAVEATIPRANLCHANTHRLAADTGRDCNQERSTVDHKASVRSEVFAVLRTVALPDSRFHFDFGEFIADFQGSDAANQRLVNHRYYQDAQVIFITPDNCLEQLRHRALLDGKTVLTTSYSIKRGFWLLSRASIA